MKNINLIITLLLITLHIKGMELVTSQSHVNTTVNICTLQQKPKNSLYTNNKNELINEYNYCSFGPENRAIFITKNKKNNPEKLTKEALNKLVTQKYKKRVLKNKKKYGRFSSFNGYEEPKPYASVITLIQYHLNFKKKTFDLEDFDSMIKLIVNYALAQDGHHTAIHKNSIIDRLRKGEFQEDHVFEIFKDVLKRNPTIPSDVIPIIITYILKPAHVCICATVSAKKQHNINKLVLPTISLVTEETDTVPILKGVECILPKTPKLWYRAWYEYFFNDPIE